MNVQEMCSKQENKAGCTEARPNKRSLKDPSVGFTKAVIICDSSEISKNEETTYRPNNIVVELLKKDSMRYGKVTFTKLASEQKIREELCSRFPILQRKTFRIASADQYGKFNFRKSEEWTGRNLRRWLPGSSAMYLILKGSHKLDESSSQEHHHSTECNSPSSGISYTTMRTATANETMFLRNNSRSQRALLEFLSSPEKAKIDDIKRRKIFDISFGNTSKSRSLPRSYSFHSLTDPALVKTEQIDTNRKYDTSCRLLENTSTKRKRKYVADGNVSLDSSAYPVDDNLLPSKRIAYMSRTMDPISLEGLTPHGKKEKLTDSVDSNLLRLKLIARTSRTVDFPDQHLSRFSNEKRIASSLVSQDAKVTYKRDISKSMNLDTKIPLCNNGLDTSVESSSVKPSVIKWLSRSRDTPTKSPVLHDVPHDHRDQSSNSPGQQMRSSLRRHGPDLNHNCNSMACDEIPNHSSDEDNDVHMSADSSSSQNGSNHASERKFQYLSDSTSSNRADFRKKEQHDKSNFDEEKIPENNHRDISPCVVPCYMIPNPMYASQFYRSMATVTSSTPSICVPTKETLSWEHGKVISRPCVMPYKGNVAILPLGFASPYSGVSSYGYSLGNLATTSGNVDESSTQSPRNQQCQDKPDSHCVHSKKKVERTSLLQKYLRSIEEHLSSTSVKNESTDQSIKTPCGIVPSKGTCKGGDVFVIVFKQSLHEELKKTRLSLNFGETEIDELTYVNPFTIKGVVPESVRPGSVSVTIVTSDGELIGSTKFTYVDDFIDGLTKTMFADKHGEVLLDFITSSLEQGHSKLQDKMADIMELLVCMASQNGVKTARDKILNSILGNKLKHRLSNNLWDQDHVAHNGSHDDEENETNREGISIHQDQCETDKTTLPVEDVQYRKRVPFLPSDVTVDQEELYVDDKEQTNGIKRYFPTDLKEADNLILLSSIASRIKHDTPYSDHSDSSSSSHSSSTRPDLSSHVRKSLSSDCNSSGFHKKVFVLPPDSRYLPSQSELCKLRMSGNFYSKVHFDVKMNEDDVMEQIKKTFPDLKDSRIRLAMVDQTGKLVFHDEIWTGKSIRRKLRGNSVLYVAPIG